MDAPAVGSNVASLRRTGTPPDIGGAAYWADYSCVACRASVHRNTSKGGYALAAESRAHGDRRGRRLECRSVLRSRPVLEAPRIAANPADRPSERGYGHLRSAAALHRGAAVREPQRRQGARILLRRADRGTAELPGGDRGASGRGPNLIVLVPR